MFYPTNVTTRYNIITLGEEAILKEAKQGETAEV